MLNFEKFVNEVLKDMDEVGEFKKYLTQTKADTASFLSGAEADIKLWTEQVTEGKMSKKEFESLVGGLPTSAAFRALTEAGLKQVEVDKMKKKVTSIIIEVAIRTLL
jgi:hypothetical protein